VSIQQAIGNILAGRDLTGAEMAAAMRTIMSGHATPAQIGGFLMALRAKGETVEEIAAAATVMREFATRVSIDAPHLVDIVGTGGDGAGTFNISTTAAFVISAAGGKVAKHNNRSVSSRTGSADVLEAAGVRLDLNPAQILQCIEEIGVGFMFAPSHHGATRHAAGPRKELGVRTVFNLLGPLTNPAGVRNQLIGVFDRIWVRPVAEVLKKLGSRHVLVVHSADGLDEISISAPTFVAELKEGAVTEYEITPAEFGMAVQERTAITVADAAGSLQIMRAVLGGATGPARDIVMLNAGAAIYAADLCPDMAAGIAAARNALDSGAAMEQLDRLVTLTQKLARQT